MAKLWYLSLYAYFDLYNIFVMNDDNLLKGVYRPRGDFWGFSPPPLIYVDICIYAKSSVFIHWSTSLTLTSLCFLPPTGWFAVTQIVLTCWNRYNLSYEYNIIRALHMQDTLQNEAPPHSFQLVSTPLIFLYLFSCQVCVCIPASVFCFWQAVTCRARTWFGTCNWWHSCWSFFHWWSAQSWTLQQQHSAP